MENRNTRFPEDLVNVRVQANTSYQIELMSCSKIMPNSGSEPRLRQFATFKDLKYSKIYPRVVAVLEDLTSLFVFYEFLMAIRRSIYTTNLIENLNIRLLAD